MLCLYLVTMPLDEDGGSEGVVLVVEMVVGRREISCGEGEDVFCIIFVRGGRG